MPKFATPGGYVTTPVVSDTQELETLHCGRVVKYDMRKGCYNVAAVADSTGLRVTHTRGVLDEKGKLIIVDEVMVTRKEDINKAAIEEIYTGYGKKTLVSGWNFAAESYPRDNPESEQDQAISTYKRLGVYDIPTPPSTMRDSQVMAMSLPRPSRSYRPMVNVVTYPHLFGENRRASIEKAGLKPPPPGYGCTDYLTTHQVSYTYLMEEPMSTPPPMTEVFKPVTKFRKLLTDPFNIKRPNLGTFLDDNMDYLKDIRKSECAPPPYGLDYQPVWTWEIK